MVTKPIVVIVGQTATGKSAAAIEIALRYGGEIICADSRTIYKGMDIGTAKPSANDRSRVPHHGLDLIDPSQTFSAYDFQQYARAKIDEIHSRGRVPIVVGGSGLYVDGLLYNYDFGDDSDSKFSQDLRDKSLKELQDLARENGIDESYQSFKNPRHLAGVIKRGKKTLQKKQLPKNVLLYAIHVDQELLKQHISDRVNLMLDMGLIDEATRLVADYGAKAPGLFATTYKPYIEYILDECTLDEARTRAVRNDTQLAKRQMTWFKRDPNINWVQSVDELKKEITPYLTKI